MDSIKNKVAIVTGGTRGIGRAIAERLLNEGAAVALCGRSQDSVDSAVARMKPLGRVFGQAADVKRKLVHQLSWQTPKRLRIFCCEVFSTKSLLRCKKSKSKL